MPHARVPHSWRVLPSGNVARCSNCGLRVVAEVDLSFHARSVRPSLRTRLVLAGTGQTFDTKQHQCDYNGDGVPASPL